MAKIFVTGGTGFIGQRLVERLLRDGHEVLCGVRPRSIRSHLEIKARDLPGELRFVIADVGIPDTLGGPIHEAEIVLHLAAMLRAPWDPGFDYINAEGTRNIFEHAAESANPPKVVLVSSVAACGPAPDGPDGRARVEADPAGPVSRYGRSKRAGEVAAEAHAGRVPVTIIRPPAVFGPGDRNSLKLFETAAKGWAVVPTSGEPRMSMVHVDDLVWGIVAAMERGERMPADPATDPGRGVYFLAHPEQPTIATIGQWIGGALGKDVRVAHLPAWVTHTGGAMGEAWARMRGKSSIVNLDKAREATAGSWICAVDKAHAQLGFAPPRTMQERLTETALWYREQGWLPR